MAIKDILFIESNDDVTTVYATDGSLYRNKTPISQWEAILGADFIRIHRSYLANMSAIDSVEPDLITAKGHEQPVSRKYKESVRGLALLPDDPAAAGDL